MIYHEISWFTHSNTFSVYMDYIYNAWSHIFLCCQSFSCCCVFEIHPMCKIPQNHNSISSRSVRFDSQIVYRLNMCMTVSWHHSNNRRICASKLVLLVPLCLYQNSNWMVIDWLIVSVIRINIGNVLHQKKPNKICWSSSAKPLTAWGHFY